jgi:hypothetical protein
MMQYSSEADEEDLGDLPLEVLPGDGSTIGNLSAREALSRVAERQISEEEYATVKDRLVGLGLILKGQGRGGSVRLAEGIEGGSRYEAPSAPAARQQQVPQQWQLPATHLRGQRRQRSLQRCSRVCVAPAEASEVSGCSVAVWCHCNFIKQVAGTHHRRAHRGGEEWWRGVGPGHRRQEGLSPWFGVAHQQPV